MSRESAFRFLKEMVTIEWCRSDFFCAVFSNFPCTMAEVAICGNSEH